MNEAGHAAALDELRRARGRLSAAEDIRAYAELSFGMAFHVISVGAQRQHGVHREQHEGLTRWLRERGHAEAATALAELESLRLGRWYGRQGNGDAATKIDELLAQLEAWAVA